MESNIPKIIHYCWFGGNEIPKVEAECIASWRKQLKGYTFKLWNEQSFDIKSSKWTLAAYQDKKYAFVADYVRLAVLYEYGGIYLDTDIKLIKSFDSLLNQDAFMGFEDGVCVSCGVIAVKPHNKLIKEILDVYNSDSFLYEEHKQANVKMVTELLCRYGLKQNNTEQYIYGMHIYPKTYFNPMDYYGNWDKTKDTYCIHLYSGSWLSKEEQEKLQRRKKPLVRLKKRVRSIIRKVISGGVNTDTTERTDIKMGTNVDLINSFLDYSFGHLITIGNNVTITNATILTHDASTKKTLGYSKIGRVDIGNDVFIGYGAIVLPNTRIGNRVIVGAGTVVAKDIPDNSVVAGNPMRIICTFDEYMAKNKERMKEVPVYNVLFSNKTEEDRQAQYEELVNFQGGYDL